MTCVFRSNCWCLVGSHSNELISEAPAYTHLFASGSSSLLRPSLESDKQISPIVSFSSVPWRPSLTSRGKEGWGNGSFYVQLALSTPQGSPSVPDLLPVTQSFPVPGLRPESGAVFSQRDSCNFKGQWNTPSAGPSLSNSTSGTPPMHLRPASGLEGGFTHRTRAGCERKGAYSIVKQLVVSVTNSADSSTTVNTSASLSRSLSCLHAPLCQVGHLRLCSLLLFSLALLTCLL